MYMCDGTVTRQMSIDMGHRSSSDTEAGGTDNLVLEVWIVSSIMWTLFSSCIGGCEACLFLKFYFTKHNIRN